jgi:hypothetical protein
MCVSEEIVLYEVKRNNLQVTRGEGIGVKEFYSGEGNLSDENLKSDEVFIAETHERGSQGEVNRQRQNRPNKPVATAS